MKSIPYQGSKLAYQEAGDSKNPTIVLLHGNSSNSAFFMPQLASSLADDYHLIAPDFLGHGASGFIESETHVKPIGLAQSILALVEALAIKELLLYGISLGGHVAMECIPLLGTRLKGIMVSGAPPVKSPLNMEEAFLPEEAFGVMMQADLSDEAIALWLSTAIHKDDKVRESVKTGLLKTIGNFRSLMANSLQSADALSDEKQLLENFKGPIALLNGTHEPFVAIDYLKSMEMENLYTHEIIEIPDSAHYPSAENTEAFNKVLFGFSNTVFK